MKTFSWKSFSTLFSDELYHFAGELAKHGRRVVGARCNGGDDTWIDCLSYLQEDAGMTRFLLAEGERLYIEVEAAEDFKSRLPEMYRALRECVSLVNRRYTADGAPAVLSLVLL